LREKGENLNGMKFGKKVCKGPEWEGVGGFNKTGALSWLVYFSVWLGKTLNISPGWGGSGPTQTNLRSAYCHGRIGVGGNRGRSELGLCQNEKDIGRKRERGGSWEGPCTAGKLHRSAKKSRPGGEGRQDQP